MDKLILFPFERIKKKLANEPIKLPRAQVFQLPQREPEQQTLTQRIIASARK